MADKPSEKNGRFDTGLIRELAAILREADLGEIEIEQGGAAHQGREAWRRRPCTMPPAYAPLRPAAAQQPALPQQPPRPPRRRCAIIRAL